MSHSLARCRSLSEGQLGDSAFSPTARAWFGMPPICNYSNKITNIFRDFKEPYGFI